MRTRGWRGRVMAVALRLLIHPRSGDLEDLPHPDTSRAQPDGLSGRLPQEALPPRRLPFRGRQVRESQTDGALLGTLAAGIRPEILVLELRRRGLREGGPVPVVERQRFPPVRF